MRDDVLNSVPSYFISSDEFFDHLREYTDSKFEDQGTILVNFLLAPWVPSTQKRRPVAIGSENMVNEPRSAVSALQNHSSGPVTKEHARGQVIGVQYSAHGFSSNEQNTRSSAARKH